MGIFQQFPYTNFHEMNLDEILRILKEMSTEWEETKTEWASYKDFIDHFFENHNITENVLEALRIMFADGEIAPYINKYYDTLSGMIADTSLLPGVVARTLGGSSLNDGKGETYYISESEIFGKDHVDLANGLWASPLSTPFNCELISNDDNAIQAIADCALNWIQNKDDIRYGGDKNMFFDDTAKINGYWQMTCSIFAMAVAFGIDFDHSKYNYNATNIQNPIAYFDDDLMNKLRDPQGFYSDDILPYFMAKGYAFTPTENLSNVETGDILFISQGSAPDAFLGIDHTAIFAHHKTDTVYNVWEMGSDAGPSYSLHRYDAANYVVKMVVRVPYKSSKATPLVNDMQITTSSIHQVQQIHNYLVEGIQANKYYTFIGKITNIPDITAYPALYANGFSTQLANYSNQYVGRPYDDIYIMPFITDTAYTDVYPSIIGNPDSTALGDFEWVCLVEGFHTNIREFLPYFEVLDTFGDAITTTHTKGVLFNAHRIGRTCIVTIDLTLTSNVSAWGAIATLPAGYKPYAPLSWTDLDVTESGNIRTLKALSIGDVVKWSFTYFTTLR